jgi:transketolase
MKLKGIEASTGPLGQGLSIACGMAISLKQQKRKNTVYILMSDGECDSGQMWEAVMTANKYKLDNLVAFIDRNNCQIDGTCDVVMPTEPLADKFISFGWKAFHADGHDTDSLLGAVESAKQVRDQPSIIIASTVKGHGVSFMENSYEWHSASITDEQCEKALADLEARR